MSKLDPVALEAGAKAAYEAEQGVDGLPWSEASVTLRQGYCDEARAAILAYQSALPKLERDWRPIETAPKDGTPILLFYPVGENRPYFDDDVIELEDQIPEWIVGFWGTEYGESKKWTFKYYEGFEPNGDPTHWQPLPPPPADAIIQEISGG